MAKKIERNKNTFDTATTGTVTVNSSTAQTLVPANPDRTGLIVSNDSNNELWIRYYPASVDNIQQGILLENGRAGHWEMPTDNIYTGEVSIIRDGGGNSSFSYTEF